MSFFSGYHLCSNASSNELALAIHNIGSSGAKSVLILACDSDGWRQAEVDAILRECPLPLFGGIFPAITFNAQVLNSGTLVIGLRDRFDTYIIESVSDEPSKFSELISENLSRFDPANAMFVIVDGLAKNIENLVEELFIHYGSNVTAIGAGAGSLDFIQRPIIFSNRGLLKDAVVVATTSTNTYVGVKHGWEILDGPYLVTESDANHLIAINFQSAFDVYKEAVEKHSSLRFDQEDFFTIAKNFPLGIVSVDGELLVRDPLKVVNDVLICVGEVPQNSTFYLLKGLNHNLICASGEAAIESKKNKDDANRNTMSKNSESSDVNNKAHSALMFDCISRQLFLQEDYRLAIQSAFNGLDPNTLFLGALTLGEIANSSHGPIELLNKTTVIAHFD